MYIITGPGMKAAQQQNPGTATRVHPLKDPVENWDKGVKPDMNLFPAKRYPIIKISCENIITLGEWRHCLCNWNPTSPKPTIRLKVSGIDADFEGITLAICSSDISGMASDTR